MKRLFSICLILALTLLLTSCGREETISGVGDQSIAISVAVQTADRVAKLGIDPASNKTAEAGESGTVHKMINPTTTSVWKTGKTYTIKWESNLNGPVEIQIHPYSIWHKKTVISASAVNNGRYRWKVPSTMAPKCTGWNCNLWSLWVTHYGRPYKIASSGYFEIHKGDTGDDDPDDDDNADDRKTLEVTTPNGGESWKPGKRYTITWNKGNAGTFVKIQLLKSGRAYKTITGRTANDGNRRWTIPSTVAAGSQYKIKITSTTKNTVFDASDQNFTISKTATVDSGSTVKVTSPNGGESWKPGKRYTITWNKGGARTFVRIFLQKSGKRYKTISRKTANDGKYPWRVPATIASGSAYKVRVQSVTKSTVKDDSDSSFTVGTAAVVNDTDTNDTLPSGDYRFLNKHNASTLNGHTVRWKPKIIQVSGANGSWRAAANRWPTVRFQYVKSKPAAGKGINIAGYVDIGNYCGLANYAYKSNGEMLSCKVSISSGYDEDNCGPEGDTIAHEIGHCIGVFKHTSDGGLMDATAACMPDCDITSPVRKMISLLYSLPPGTDIKSKLSRSPGAMRRPKDSKYDPTGKKIYYGSSYFLGNGVVKYVRNQ